MNLPTALVSNRHPGTHGTVGLLGAAGALTWHFWPEPPEEPGDMDSNQLSFFPNVSIGLRYQKPGGRLLFRSAIGFPFLQLSLGYQF